MGRLHIHRSTIMKLVAVCVFAISSLVVCISKDNARQTGRNDHPVMVVAHRGGAALKPENTMAAFKNALALDFSAIELDVQLSKDETVVVIHDSSLTRSADLPGEVSDYTWAQLRTIKVSYDQTIPSFEDVLILLSDHKKPVKLHVEIKTKSDTGRYSGIEEKILALLEQYQMKERTTIISFDYPTLQTVKALDPSMKRYFLINKDYMDANKRNSPTAIAYQLHALEFDGVGINYKLLNKTLMEAFRGQGMDVGVWTVNDESSIKRMLDLDVDFITTDNPLLVNPLPERNI